MIRIVLENVLIFFIPTALYLLYTFFSTKTSDEGPSKRPTFLGALEDAPIVWLIAAGIALVGIALAIFGVRQENSIDQPYEPAIYKDGRIIQPGTNKK